MSDRRLDYIGLLWQEVSRNPHRLLDVEKEEEQEEAPPPPRTLQALCSIPRRLAISAGLGGTPVTPQLIESLRRILLGGNFRVFDYEWRKAVFHFREPNSELAYALKADGGGARAIQMVVQARIIKHLLFARQSASDGQTLHSLTEVGRREQDRALAAALSDSLWLAGQEASATVTLLQLFTFSEKDAVTNFILDHIQCFQEEGSHGVILFLYSLVCSRTIDRLRQDLDSPTSYLLQLSPGSSVCRQALLNLLLTGRASPHLFNGMRHLGQDGLPLQRPLQGVLSRSDVGYLRWSREEMERGALPQVGSMLKTPRFPVWVCSINSSCSVLFSATRSLLSDWRAEHLFQLYYYSGQSSQTATARLTVGERCGHTSAGLIPLVLHPPSASCTDTHSHHWEASPGDAEGDPEKRFPSLEMTIRTKWDGAVIAWNGTSPFY
ncbi:inactive ubiquitin carboxyl-terminal hydrolase MINDY-4B isoform X2 [Neolamprologus brichardi]|uniref:inactive ubiquitin carboxyl-terminal hydrolase MINDY-4B isoform X2 n=1 Tax=Neolamprologus brichardi TaxID=32507 RepID=UPI001643C433|nr:inactive ubiquitin carboxyl-terminal hydrolase MINDY-4B isoform X2 [Neolamprologus brichardi]